MRGAVRLVVFSMAAATSPAMAQMPGEGPTYVSVANLTERANFYNDRLVRVVGDLVNSDYEDSRNRIYVLRGDSGLDRIRVGMASGSMQELPFHVGHKVEIVGMFWDLSIVTNSRRLRDFPGALRRDEVSGGIEGQFFIGVSEVTAIEEAGVPAEAPTEPREVVRADLPDSVTVDLRELVRNPEPFYDKLISVVGKFRGDNVYNDLSMHTKKTPRDFIIKVADTAIWVTGKRPEGEGFELNPERRRDTGRWLKVTGVPWTDGGDVYLRAQLIELVDKPEDPDLEPQAVEEEVAEIEEGESPPEVIFTVPLNGERSLALDTEFRIQFSKDMNRASFDRNIDLLYGDDAGEGNPFPDMKVSYDEPSRSLVVTPGKRLEPGKEIQLILYKGIRDDGDRPLVVDPEAESEVPAAAIILRFATAGPE
ncbi:MAG: Ig-like domain-containing protein [Vicinamibacteria bacterium]